jgi:single-strand DNA-binding protein
MSSTNIAVVDGYLGKDSELTYAQSGAAFLNFSIAAKSQQKGRDGNYTDRTDWIDVKAIGKRAEGLAKILKKGAFCVVSGRIQQETWEDRETGKKRSKLIVLADNVSLGPKPGERSDRGYGAPRHSGGMEHEPPPDDEDIPF